MKIHPSTSRRAESGSAVLLVLILLVLMVVFVEANTVTVNGLQRELKLINQTQVHRLAESVAHAPLAP